MGPLNSMGPGAISPLSVALRKGYQRGNEGRAIFSHWLFLSSRRSGGSPWASAQVAFRPDGT